LPAKKEVRRGKEKERRNAGRGGRQPKFSWRGDHRLNVEHTWGGKKKKKRWKH